MKPQNAFKCVSKRLYDVCKNVPHSHCGCVKYHYQAEEATDDEFFFLLRNKGKKLCLWSVEEIAKPCNISGPGMY